MRRWWAGVFATGLVVAWLPGSSAAAVATCGGDQPDFNGDGRADLAVGAPQDNALAIPNSGSVQVFYGATGGLGTTNDAIFTQGITGIGDAPEENDEFGTSLATGDFDDDGFTDVAIGVPFEDLDATDQGAVHVLFGSPAGITAVGSQYLHQNVSGVADTAEIFDNFGAALAAGDFDGDGRCDLGVGIRFEDFDSGAIHAFYGGSSGLSTSGDQFISQNTSGIADDSETGDEFSRALAVGDFDNDGRDDLAVGVPGETINANDQGAVHIIYGSSTGLTASGDQFIHQDTSGIADEGVQEEAFGRTLAAGDFDADGRDDLVVGIPGEVVINTFEGAVQVIYGSSTGLSASGDQHIHQNTTGMADVAELSDQFGLALAVGDFDNDGRDDVAVGVPAEGVEGIAAAGAIHTIYGSSTGLTASGDQFIHQDTSGIADSAELTDGFGYALSSGDFGGDGRDDVAVGIVEDLPAGQNDEGAVHIIDGSSTGLTASGDQFLHRGLLDVEGETEVNAFFGGSLPGSVFFNLFD